MRLLLSFLMFAALALAQVSNATRIQSRAVSPAAPADTNVLAWDAATSQWKPTTASGGGGTPGGSDTQCQYNNAGSFGGITGCTTNGTAVTLVAPVLGTPASGTLTNATGLPAAGVVGTAAVLNGNNVFTANGALSSGAGPGETHNGTWITGGSTTTTKPYFLIEPTGTTSNNWVTGGTGLGVNAASGFTGNLLDLQVATVRKVSLSSTGVLTLAGDMNISAGSQYITNGRSNLYSAVNGNWIMWNAAQNDFGLLQLGGTTASFPALKRSTTKIQVRLADDSNPGTIESKYNSSDGTAGVTGTCAGFPTVKDGLVTACTGI